ncbi:MAG TPA: haloacid dehalogenase [archaeon]|nr:haloacid dehalogenase [archaeon]
MTDLEDILSKIRRELETKDQIREKVLLVSREIVRLSTQAVVSIHREDLVDAKEKLDKSKEKIVEMESALEGWPELAYSGSVSIAYQEFVEAKLLLSFVVQKKFLSQKELGVPSISYVLGLADLVGELRRRALDSIKKDDLNTAENCLTVMEDIYTLLMTIEHGDALAPGLRRKCDVARRLIEETRGDVAIESRRSHLEKSIERLERAVRGKKLK